MKLSLVKKFIIAILWSIIFIAWLNIIVFYLSYSISLKLYLYDKIEAREDVTLEYINEIVKKQTIDDIWSIFSDTEIEFFELLEDTGWSIPLDEEKNIDIVMNYLIKAGIAPKYIEEILPTDNFAKVLESFSDKSSPEAKFLYRLSLSIIVANIIAILIIIIFLMYFVRKIVYPINDITKQIKEFETWRKSSYKTKEISYYNEKDEIWLLVNSINSLNKKLRLQDDIRTRLLADISHELKTPITSIQCYLEWISDWVIKLDQKNLNSITHEMKRLISLVNKIMDYEKLERKRFDLMLSDFDIVDLTIWLVETHKKRLKENKQRIKVAWEQEKILTADRDLFIQLVHNLIWNFLKYAWKNTLLKINITKKYIEFSDNWVWVKAQEVAFLTEKFYQTSEKSWNVEFRWIWVWLSIVTKIIDSHDWWYEIKSDLWKWFSFKIYFSNVF